MSDFVVYFCAVLLLLCSMVFFTGFYSITGAALDWTWLMCLLFLEARVEVSDFWSS